MNQPHNKYLILYKKLIYIQDLCEQYQHACFIRKNKRMQKLSLEAITFIQQELVSISRLQEAYPTSITKHYVDLITFLSHHPFTSVDVGNAYSSLNVWQRHLNNLIQIIALEIESDLSIN